MKKQSIILIATGIAVLALGYVIVISINKTNTNQSSNPGTLISKTDQAETTVNVDINIKSTPSEVKTVRIKQGQKVNITVISEVSDKAHLHGYDIFTPLEAGKTATSVFVADKTGRFELEIEGSEQKLAVFEVYP